MPQPYNLTNISNANNIYELGKATNELSDGILGLGLIFSIFIITYTVTAKWGFKPAFATASYITAGLTMMFRLMNWVSDTVMFVSFLLVVASYLIMKFS